MAWYVYLFRHNGPCGRPLCFMALSNFHPFRSPLRYPGGKRKVVPYISRIIEANKLYDISYVEPYAGGGSIALALLYGMWATRIYLNDADPAIYSFWESCRSQSGAMCQLVEETPLTMDEWHRQRALLTAPDASLLERGFAAFYLNRTNRSGILLGGVMGGKNQTGEISLGDRFNRKDLARRIRKIGYFRDRIEVTNLDAVDFLVRVKPKLTRSRSLIYLDPPYYEKGQGLYGHSYAPSQHAGVAAAVRELKTPWIVSYDNVPAIKQLYEGYESLEFSLNYSTQERYQGGEIMFFSPQLTQLDVATTRTMLPPVPPLILPPPVVPALKVGQQFSLAF